MEKMQPANLSVKDAASWLGIGQTSMWSLIKTGDVKAVRLAGRTLIPMTELQRFQNWLIEGNGLGLGNVQKRARAYKKR